MSKIKVSLKELKEHYKNIIVAGYCDLQDLLSYQEPTYYNCGVYGWNFDGYIINNNTIIITGYRNLSGTHRNYNLTRFYNDLARDLKHNQYYENKITFEELKDQLNQYLQDYVKEIIKEG